MSLFSQRCPRRSRRGSHISDFIDDKRPNLFLRGIKKNVREPGERERERKKTEKMQSVWERKSERERGICLGSERGKGALERKRVLFR